MWKMKHLLRSPEGDGGGGGGSGAPAPAPAAPAPSPAAPAPSPAAPAPAPGPAPAPAPAAGPSPAPAPAAGFWSDGWRERLAGDDPKALAQLQRYGSPEDIWKKARSLEQRVSSGEFKPVLGKDATPEQLKEYRAAHGIPEDPAKYDLGKDVKIDEGDRPVFDQIFKGMHGANASPEVVKAVVQTWNTIKAQATAAQEDADKTTLTKSEDALRGDWGNEYRRNLNLIHGLLDASGDQKLKDQLLGGRLADGTPIGSSPTALKLLLAVALAQNPAGIVVPGGEGDRGKAIDDEISDIEKLMRTDRKAYNKDTAKQERLRELYSARDAVKGRLAPGRG